MNALTFIEFEKGMVETIRNVAQEVPVFRETGNGTIRIFECPLCAEANILLGGRSNFDINPPDIVKCEYSYAIEPGGSQVIGVVEDGEERDVETYGYSALKIAHALRAYSMGKGLISGPDLGIKWLKEEYGYAAHKGAILFLITKWNVGQEEDGSPTVQHKPFFLLGVCVSGAKSEEDYECASAVVPNVEKYVSEMGGGSYAVEYDESLAPACDDEDATRDNNPA